MSEQKCLTVTWTIENFSIYSGKDFLELKSQSFEMLKIHVGSKHFHLGVRVTLSEVIFRLIIASNAVNRSYCKMFLTSSCGRIPIKREDNCRFIININDIFGDKKHLVLPSDTLTVNCTISEACINIRELRFCTVLHRMNFSWNIENFNSHKRDYFNTYLDNFLLHIKIVRYVDKKSTHVVVIEAESARNGFGLHILDFKLSMKQSGSRFRYNNVKRYPDSSRWREQICIYTADNIESDLLLQIECIVAVNNDNTTTTSSTNSNKTSTSNPTSEIGNTQTVSPTSESVKTKTTSVSNQDSPGTLTNDLLSMLRGTTLSDATLNTEGKSFSAHKIVLSARSSVFKVMFEKEDTTEGRSGVVDIKDIDSETVQRLLFFLYGELLENLQWDDASKLYYASDKYAVLLLKQKCSSILKAGLSVSNACDAIVLADRHLDNELMKGVVDFVRENQEVISSSDWEKLEESEPRLAAKILRQVFVKTTTSYPTSEGIKTITLSVGVQDSPGNLTSDFLSLLRDTTLSDAILNTEGKSFSAHKVILSARSSVFKAMFEKEDTRDGRSGIVDMEDIDKETVQRLLVFLYGELLEDLQWGDASKLYYAAYKYAVLLLKQKCSNILQAGLSVSNVCAAIVLADRHSDDELMKNAVDYARNHQEVMLSSDWEKLEENDPRLAAKILRQVFIMKGKN